MRRRSFPGASLAAVPGCGSAAAELRAALAPPGGSLGGGGLGSGVLSSSWRGSKPAQPRAPPPGVGPSLPGSLPGSRFDASNLPLNGHQGREHGLRAWFNIWLLPLVLGHPGQATGALWASVSSFVKCGRGIHLPRRIVVKINLKEFM